MPLDNRKLETGTVLRARYKGTERTCKVVQTADGLRYRLDDGREFASPSSADKAAMDGVSCNGWRFWSIAGAEKPAKAKAAAKESAKARAAKPKKGKAMRAAAKRDRRVAEETDSYACGVRGETFKTMKAARSTRPPRAVWSTSTDELSGAHVDHLTRDGSRLV